MLCIAKFMGRGKQNLILLQGRFDSAIQSIRGCYGLQGLFMWSRLKFLDTERDAVDDFFGSFWVEEDGFPGRDVDAVRAEAEAGREP